MVLVKRATLASVVVLALITNVAALTAPPAMAQTVRWVNVTESTPVPPGTSCDNAGYTTIGAAVAAAAAGDTVVVCPGTYAESVQVNKSITLRGFNTTLGKCFKRETLSPDPARDTIVNPLGSFSGTAFNVTADGVSIQRFVITDADAGIQTNPATAGHTFRENTLLLNRFGIRLNTDGASRTAVTKNCFRQNAAAASGDAIFSNEGVRNVQISDNEFFKTIHVPPATETADIVMFGVVVDVQISRNESRDGETFASITGSNGSSITRNEIDGDRTASAIFVGGGTTGMVISDNKIEEARRGIRFCQQCTGGAAATGVTVADNKIKGMVEDGIVANPGSLTSSVIDDNDAKKNRRDGIRIETPGNANNLIKDNEAEDNAGYDCRDDTTGGGTAGTANTWRKNEGKTSLPSGLCKD
jgi:nitrous oxidase accessory protein NosD